MDRLKKFFSDLFAMLLMGAGVSTTRPKQRKIDLQRLVAVSGQNGLDTGNSRDRRERWILANCLASSVEYKGQQSVRLDAGNREGLAWIERLQFKISKVDLAIAAVKQEVGIAFRVWGEREFEAICFQVEEEARREGNLQRVFLRYISRGLSTGLSSDASIESQFDLPYSQTGEWFKARVTISSEVIAVFINGSNVPSLRVDNTMGERTDASVGIWVGAGSSALVSDFRFHEVKDDIESQFKRIMGR